MAATAGALLVAGCGTTGSSAHSAVMAQVGTLQITKAFIPQPPSPSVAALYLTVHDSGPTPDELVSATTTVARISMLMTEDEKGSVGSMAPLARLLIPAHGQASLIPGHDHVMLENLDSTLRVGQHVEMTLVFARAGRVSVSVPVVPLTDILNDGDSTGSGSMANMPGMSGSS